MSPAMLSAHEGHGHLLKIQTPKKLFLLQVFYHGIFSLQQHQQNVNKTFRNNFISSFQTLYLETWLNIPLIVFEARPAEMNLSSIF